MTPPADPITAAKAEAERIRAAAIADADAIRRAARDQAAAILKAPADALKKALATLER
jgi:cell division septum initiation protein DivIVA